MHREIAAKEKKDKKGKIKAYQPLVQFCTDFAAIFVSLRQLKYTES